MLKRIETGIVRRLQVACDVRRAGSVHRDRGRHIISIAAQIRRIFDHRIDGQRRGMIVMRKRHLHTIVAANGIAAIDFATGLIHLRSALPHTADEQIPGRLLTNRLVESDLNSARVGSGLNDEIVFELSFGVAVINDIDTWINIMKPSPAEMRHARAPFGRVAPDVVVADSRKRIEAFRARVRVGVLQPQHNCGSIRCDCRAG